MPNALSASLETRGTRVSNWHIIACIELSVPHPLPKCGVARSNTAVKGVAILAMTTVTENGVGNKVDETETETIAPTDREFVLTTKNLERVREDLRQEEVLHGKKSPLKSVSASPNKHELVNLQIPTK